MQKNLKVTYGVASALVASLLFEGCNLKEQTVNGPAEKKDSATTDVHFYNFTKLAPARKSANLVWVPPPPLVTIPPPIYDMSPHLPPIGNQGAQNSCAAWSVTYYAKTMKEKMTRGGDQTQPTNQFSPAFTFNQQNLGGVCQYGSDIGTQMWVLQQMGADKMAYFPYDPRHNGCLTMPDAASKARALPYKIKETYNIPPTQQTVENVKNVLLRGNPIILGFAIYPDYSDLNNSTNKIYDNFGGARMGMHANIIVGYDDYMQAFKVANQWGITWGNGGYGWIAYSAILDARLEGQMYLFDNFPLDAKPKADLIIHDNTVGGWTLARSMGLGFTPLGSWLTGFAVGAGYDLLSADFNGDGRADILARDRVSTNANVHVAVSNGIGFLSDGSWLSSWVIGAGYTILTGDVNGGGKVDIIAKEKATGNWTVAVSTGTVFTDKGIWLSNFAAGTGYENFAADVDGDGKADLIAQEIATGKLMVVKSTGTGFGSKVQWGTGIIGGTGVSYLAADVSGDGKADVIAKDNAGVWRVYKSTGTAFSAGVIWGSGFAVGVGYTVYAADVTGDGKADLVARDLISAGTGRWYIWESNGSAFVNGRVAIDGYANGAQYTGMMGDATGM